jgi:hypothetical protein
VFLNITGDNEKLLAGEFRFVQIMLKYLGIDPDDEHALTSEADYARAFCEYRHEVFPDCEGLYRERYGLLVALPNAVLKYERLVPALKHGHFWPGGPRTSPSFVRKRLKSNSPLSRL